MIGVWVPCLGFRVEELVYGSERQVWALQPRIFKPF